MADEIVRYKDRDGAEITLTPQDVAQYCATGGAQLTQRDVVNFMATCKALGANPFTRDVYLVKYSSSDSASIIAGKNYYTRVAAQMESFDGMRAGIVVVGPDGSLVNREGCIALGNEQVVGGWAEVHDKRWSVPIRAEVALSEYNTGKNLWRSKPQTMIRKVALVQALREAYPDRFAGVYDSSEMPEPSMPQQPQQPPVQQAQGATSSAAAEQPDMVWIGGQASMLAGLGYDAAEVSDYLLAKWQQEGRAAAEQAVAQMQGSTQPPAQEVEAIVEEAI